jgi:hypothetical protein
MASRSSERSGCKGIVTLVAQHAKRGEIQDDQAGDLPRDQAVKDSRRQALAGHEGQWAIKIGAYFTGMRDAGETVSFAFDGGWRGTPPAA